MIKNIIFDLGGVIYNINYYNIAATFKKFGFHDFDQKYSQEYQTDGIDLFEEGKISIPEFRHYIRSLTNVTLSDEEIDQAWNSIMIDIPKHRIELLKEVKQHYNIFLFSNTNALNYQKFYPEMEKKFGFDIFTQLFQKSFFSHLIHLRKPKVESFEFIIHNLQLNAPETLFIDDTQRHVEGAIQAGLNAFLLPKNQDITTLFTKGVLNHHLI